MRKSIKRTLLAAAAMSAFFSLSAWAEEAVVTGSEVNVRSGPGTFYQVVDSLSKGRTVNVTDRSNAGWYQISYDGGTGFMSSGYLQLSGGQAVLPQGGQAVPPQGGQAISPQGGQSQAQTSQGYINAMYVRFRSAPGEQSSVLGSYNRGKSLTILGTVSGWTQCVIDGQTGYVYSQYVSQGSLSGQQTEDPFGSGQAVPPQQSQPVQPDHSSPVPQASPAPTPVPTAPAQPSQQTPGFINADQVRFRSGAGTNYPIIDSYDRGTAVIITGSSGEWTACTINGVNGYVHSKYVMVGQNAGITLPGQGQQVPQAPQESQPPAAVPQPTPQVDQSQWRKGYIAGNNVRMRQQPSMDSSVVAELFYGNAVTITGSSGEWTAVNYGDKSGFVYSKYVKEGDLTVEQQPGQNAAPGTATGEQVAQFALQYVGYKYTWGGKSPETGFDCSGLVYYVYQQFGYTLNRVACDQANNGVHVDKSQLQPGDILCFYSGGSYIGHTGIYIGGNKFVHAGNSSTGVIVSELEGYYLNRGFEARRIIN